MIVSLETVMLNTGLHLAQDQLLPQSPEKLGDSALRSPPAGSVLGHTAFYNSALMRPISICFEKMLGGIK